MFDHLSRAFERSHLADSGHIAAIPLDAEFEVFVRIETLRINGELCHSCSLKLDLKLSSRPLHARFVRETDGPGTPFPPFS